MQLDVLILNCTVITKPRPSVKIFISLGSRAAQMMRSEIDILVPKAV